MRLWLAKEEDFYVIFQSKPSVYDKVQGIFRGKILAIADGDTMFCHKQFERITGIKLKVGEVREIEKITFKLKPVKGKGKR